MVNFSIWKNWQMLSKITLMWNKNKKKERYSVLKSGSLSVFGIRSNTGYRIFILLLFLILVVSILISVSTGVAGGNLLTLINVKQDESIQLKRIMLEMRVPRALAACFTGAAFAVSGGVMQGVTRNPLADAGLLGINAGAGFFVALTAVLLPSLPAVGTMFSAFLGAMLAVVMVYGLGTGKHKSGTIRLILAGSAVSALLTALSQGISLTFGLAKDLSFWTAGSLSGITWNQLLLTIPWITGGGVAALLLSRQLSVLAFGEESAAGLGVSVRSVRLMCILAVLIMSGASVSIVGGISFLGLIVPHAARFVIGGEYRKIIPVSALSGAILLVLADIAARTIHAPFDTPVGALVSALGVPVFMGMAYRKKGVEL
jgi:iron complex transport system permease protein